MEFMKSMKYPAVSHVTTHVSESVDGCYLVGIIAVKEAVIS